MLTSIKTHKKGKRWKQSKKRFEKAKLIRYGVLAAVTIGKTSAKDNPKSGEEWRR